MCSFFLLPCRGLYFWDNFIFLPLSKTYFSTLNVTLRMAPQKMSTVPLVSVSAYTGPLPPPPIHKRFTFIIVIQIFYGGITFSLCLYFHLFRTFFVLPKLYRMFSPPHPAWWGGGGIKHVDLCFCYLRFCHFFGSCLDPSQCSTMQPMQPAHIGTSMFGGN